MPASLITFLQNNKNCLRADLFTILLPTGQTLTATSGPWDITVPVNTPGWGGPTTTFYSVQNGKWSRGSVTSEASFNLTSSSMSLTLAPQVGTAYPGLSIGMLSAAANGLFDAATVLVYTAYMPIGQYGTVSAGIETKFFGTITKVTEITRVLVEFECSDPFFLLNLKVPQRLLQTNCPWSFGDGNCNPPGGAAAHTQTFTAGSGSNQWVLNPTAVPGNLAVAEYYAQGPVKCLTGQNAGLSQMVKFHNTTVPILQMMNKWLLPVNPGDTFSVLAGCDKSFPTCTNKFNNAIHYAGMPFIPIPTTAF